MMRADACSSINARTCRPFHSTAAGAAAVHLSGEAAQHAGRPAESVAQVRLPTQVWILNRGQAEGEREQAIYAMSWVPLHFEPGVMDAAAILVPCHT